MRKHAPIEWSAEKELAAAAALKEAFATLLADDPELLLNTIEGETSLLEMVDALALADSHDVALQSGIKDAIGSLESRQERVERRVATRRALIERVLAMLETKKLERPVATFTLRDLPPKVEIQDDADLPARFWKPGAPKLDRSALKEALEAGEAVPGARLTNGSQSLTIRRS